MIRLILLFIFFTGVVRAQVLINEVSASNRTAFADGFGEFEDWIELYNPGPGVADVSNHFLSDNPALPTKWQIPAGTTIAAGGFRSFFCSGRDLTTGELHTNFKLTQTTGETVLFSDIGAALIDSYTLQPTLVNQSRGRFPNGGPWKVLMNATPGAANSANAFAGYTANPQMSLGAGIYPTAQTLSITSTDAGVTIRYTLDGSEPGATAPAYSAPLNIATNTVVRARSYPPAGSSLTPGFIENNSYFIGITHTVPVVSLISDEYSDLFGNSSYEIKTGIEYFDASGTFQWESYGEADPHGNDSWAYPQKGVDFVVRDQYGYDNEIEYQIFPTKPRQEFQRIMFKAGASDNYPFSGAPNPSCHLRDAFVQTLAEKAHMHVDYRSNDHCVVYINGEYWGVYEIREKVNDPDYTDYYWGQEEEDLDFLSYWGGLNVRYGSPDDWNDLYAYIMANDLSVQANYDAVAARFDIASAIDYMIINTWSVNSDWINWNTMWWRGRGTPEVKWKYALWDMDNTFNLGQNFSGWNTMGFDADPCDLEDNPGFINAGPNEGHLDMFGKLMANLDFKTRFVNRYAEMINTYLNCDVAIAHLDSIAAHIAPEMPGQIAEWGGTFAEWESNLDYLRNQINGRCEYIVENGVVDCYEVDGPWRMAFNVVPASAGTVRFNELQLPEYPWAGDYFGGVEGEIEATAVNPMYEFDYWEVINTTTLNTDTFEALNSFLISASDSIIAHFRLVEQHPIVILVDPPGTGNVSINGITPASYPYSQMYAQDFSISLSATPALNYEFVAYTDNYHIGSPDSLQPDLTFLVDTPDTIIAHFKPLQTWFITYLVNPEFSGKIKVNGTYVDGYPVTREYFPGDEIATDAYVVDEYLFSHWTLNYHELDFDSSSIENSFTIDTTDTLTAHYSLKEIVPQTLYIANSFTPDGDGVNDLFQVYYSETMKKGEIEIYNRRGERVFRSFSLDSSWDGTVNGNDVPAGIYRFKIKYYIKPSFYQFVEGQITLFR